MPWIKQIDESEATDKRAELYQQLGRAENRQAADGLGVELES